MIMTEGACSTLCGASRSPAGQGPHSSGHFTPSSAHNTRSGADRYSGTTTAGETDALLRVRADDLKRLREIVTAPYGRSVELVGARAQHSALGRGGLEGVFVACWRDDEDLGLLAEQATVYCVVGECRDEV